MKKKKPILDRYSKGTQRRIRVLLGVLCFLVLICVYYISTGIGNIVSSNKLLEDKYIELAQEEQRRTILMEDIQKFDDPDYIRQYARGEYHYTAPGEFVFILPDDPESIDTQGNDQHVEKETTQNAS